VNLEVDASLAYWQRKIFGIGTLYHDAAFNRNDKGCLY